MICQCLGPTIKIPTRIGHLYPHASHLEYSLSDSRGLVQSYPPQAGNFVPGNYGNYMHNGRGFSGETLSLATPVGYSLI